jgi:TldD protein
MRLLCQEALHSAVRAGAEYADVRIIEAEWEAVRTYGGLIAGVDHGRNRGLGVRVLVDGFWGYASGTDLSPSAVSRLGDQAAELAAAGGLLLGTRTRMSPTEPIEDTWRTPVLVDPFSLTVAERADLLLETERLLRYAPAVRAMAGQIACSREIKYFASTDDSYIVQERIVTGAGYRALAVTTGGSAVRSFPQAMGQLATGGYEVVESIGLPQSAERIADEVTQLIYAPAPETGIFDVILGGSCVAAVLHDTLGHALELDRGGFLALEMLGHRRLGSDHVTVVADSIQPHGLGTAAYDDDGVPASEWTLIDAGVWSGLLVDRQSAAAYGVDATSGSARSAGFNRSPMVRMHNISLLPGSADLDDLVSSIEHGYLIDTPSRLQTSAGASHFRCECEVGWEIDRGRIRQMVAAPVVEADTGTFWKSCDAVCDDTYYMVWGLQDCAKGEPAQILGTGHGASPALFRGVALSEADDVD